MSEISTLVDAVRAFIVLAVRPLIDPIVETVDRTTNRMNSLHTDYVNWVEQLGSRVSRLEMASGVTPSGDLADKVKMLEDRCADLTKLIGRLIDVDDIPFTLDNRKLLLNDQFSTYLMQIAESEANHALDTHMNNYYHETSLGELKYELRDWVEELANGVMENFEWDSLELYNLIEGKVEEAIDDKIAEAQVSDMEDKIETFLEGKTFTLTMS